MRIFAILLAGLLACGAGNWILASDEDGTAGTPLDLPSGGGGAEDDEDAPESITFYGAEFEAEAFFWCVDRSGSMQGGPIATLKAEMGDAINQLSRRTQFGIVSFGSDEDAMTERPLPANTTNKSQGVGYIESMVAFGWTCMPDAASHICVIANKCRLRNKTIILVGDGMPYCGSLSTLLTEETLDALAAGNYRRIPVNTIFISADEAGIAFFRQIASLYGGDFIYGGD